MVKRSSNGPSKSRKKHSSLKGIPDGALGNGEFRVQKAVATADSVGGSEHVFKFEESTNTAAATSSLSGSISTHIPPNAASARPTCSATSSRSAPGRFIASPGRLPHSPHRSVTASPASLRFSPYHHASSLPRFTARQIRDSGFHGSPPGQAHSGPAYTLTSYPTIPGFIPDEPYFGQELNVLHQGFDLTALHSPLPSLSPIQLYRHEERPSVTNENENYPVGSPFLPQHVNIAAEPTRLDPVDIDVPNFLQFAEPGAGQPYYNGQYGQSNVPHAPQYNPPSPTISPHFVGHPMSPAQFSEPGMNDWFWQYHGADLPPASQDVGLSSVAGIDDPEYRRYYDTYDQQSPASGMQYSDNQTLDFGDYDPLFPADFPLQS